MQPLPRYTARVWLRGRGQWAYYFKLPAWAADSDDERGRCPIASEPLGTDYAAAVARVENVLLKQFDSWRTRGLSDFTPERAPVGTLDWLFGVYRATDQFKELSRGQRCNHLSGFNLVGGYILKDGRRLGSVDLRSIGTDVVDPLYANLRRHWEVDADGKPMRDAGGELKFVQAKDDDGRPLSDAEGRPVWLERRTTANHAMKSCLRAWNVAWRLHKDMVPLANPFAKMGLEGSDGSVLEATYGELLAAVRECDARGLRSLAAALMLTWEWLQREEHIFKAFRLDHYRPRERPHEVLVVHPKSGDSVWVPLFDQAGTALFPELMARMDALKRDRIGSGLFLVRDWVDRRAKVPLPWPSPKGYLSEVARKTKAIIAAAGLDEMLTFTSFRHGGFTELGDSDLTDAQIRALSRQKSSRIVRGYVKRTQAQIIEGTRKRRAARPASAAPEVQLTFDQFFREGRGGRR